MAQAIDYADRLRLAITFATNGKQTYRIGLETSDRRNAANFPTPDELWQPIFASQNNWRDKFAAEPYRDVSGTKPPRFYQENATAAGFGITERNGYRLHLIKPTLNSNLT